MITARIYKLLMANLSQAESTHLT